MWNEPERAELSFGLYGGGTIEFARARRGRGQTVGTCPLMARVRVPTECGGDGVPAGWFRINQNMALHQLKALFNESGNNFVPDWLRADLFEHHYRRAQERLSALEGGGQDGELRG
jgi:hypothetical protein